MRDDQAKSPSDADADLEREIRQQRKFSMAEAMGRMAGPGVMKGASPVPRHQQAEADIEGYLERHLIDSAGALPAVLLRQIRTSGLLLNGVDPPLVALETHVRRVLESEYLQSELVREADVEWGRLCGERPFFEKEGCPPHPDDRYTTESIRTSLLQLVEKLNAGET